MKKLHTKALGLITTAGASFALVSHAMAHPGHGVDVAHLHGEDITSAWMMGLNIPTLGALLLVVLALAIGGIALYSDRRARTVIGSAARAAREQAQPAPKQRGPEQP